MQGQIRNLGQELQETSESVTRIIGRFCTLRRVNVTAFKNMKFHSFHSLKNKNSILYCGIGSMYIIYLCVIQRVLSFARSPVDEHRCPDLSSPPPPPSCHVWGIPLHTLGQIRTCPIHPGMKQERNNWPRGKAGPRRGKKNLGPLWQGGEGRKHPQNEHFSQGPEERGPPRAREEEELFMCPHKEAQTKPSEQV